MFSDYFCHELPTVRIHFKMFVAIVTFCFILPLLTTIKGLHTLVLVKKIEKFFIAFSESTYPRESFSKKSATASHPQVTLHERSRFFAYRVKCGCGEHSFSRTVNPISLNFGKLTYNNNSL